QANFKHDNGLNRTSKVGSYPPNSLGLYDMHGNVWERCEDVIRTNPRNRGGTSRHSSAGGCWRLDAGRSRAASRVVGPPGFRDDMHGLRLVRVLTGKESITEPPPDLTEEMLATRFKNGLNMEFALVPKGKVWLGGRDGKPGNQEAEIPYDFYLGVYEVTQEEWQKVMGKNPSRVAHTGPPFTDAEMKRFPVNNVSWVE